MKRLKGNIIIFLAAIIVIVTLVINYTGSNLFNSSSINSHNLTTNYEEILYPPESIDDLIAVSHYIVVGKTVSEEQFSSNSYKYIFAVDNYLKGDAYSDRIEVYESKSIVHKAEVKIEFGNEYLLFLDYYESELWPNPSHASMTEYSNIKINGNSLIGDSRFIGNMDRDQLIDYILKSPLLTVTTQRDYDIKDEAKDVEDLINSSDYIIYIKVLDVEFLNQNVASAGHLIIERFKGGRLGMGRLFLPADIEAGEEYLIFLRDRNSSKTLTTRNGSVIGKKDKEQWDKMMSKLKDL